MKKVFLAVLAIAAMMVSCQKEGLVDNQKETPEVEVNEPQPVILGSNLFKAPVTKGAVNNIGEWRREELPIYVWALNQADNTKFIEDVPATLAAATDQTPDAGNSGSLILKDPGDDNVVDDEDAPFYYGTDNADIYDFYAYYLGYALDGDGVNPEVDQADDVITVSKVQIKGDNDIMFATTDRVADAINNEGQMVNPNLLYSQYSARHGVTPNLVFKHQLSKFTFYVQYAGETECDIDLMNITFNNVSKSGTITLSKNEQKFEAATGEGNVGSIILGDDIVAEDAEALKADLPWKQTEDVYDLVGHLMVAPTVAPEAEYNITINFKQTINGKEISFNNDEKLKPANVKDDEGNVLSLDSFEAGKNYNVYITVYGLEEVKVDVTLTEWDEAGKIIIDRDAETDGIMKQVTATYDDGVEGTENKTCILYAEAFEAEKDIYCVFTGEGEDVKLVKAPVGTYTFTAEVGDLPSGTIITVNEEGKIEERAVTGVE